MKILAFLLGMSSAAAGLYAAWLWWQASRVEIDPMWDNVSTFEHVDIGQSNATWIVAGMRASARSGKLNRSAARWTALAVMLSALVSVCALLQ